MRRALIASVYKTSVADPRVCASAALTVPQRMHTSGTRLVPEKHVKHVVIGGGVAGGYAMREFARHGEADVALVSAERVPPYERPALTKGYLAGSARLPGFHVCAGTGGAIQDMRWYAANAFDPGLLLRTMVDKVDFTERRVMLDRGISLVYDRCVDPARLITATPTHTHTHSLSTPSSHT